MANNYSKLSKEELLKVVEKLESRKKYGLIWDEERTKEQFEKESENALPVLKEVKGKEIKTDPSKPVNILIEGDNYHALSVLNYTHQGKIDVIYIDPPYNTGAKDWKYNNNYVDKNDTWRHSKWISMMNKRIRLSKDLLKDSGVIMVAIDDHEVHNLRHLLDDIFGENNYISTVCIEVNPAGQNIRENAPAISHDYCLIYAKSIDDVDLILRELSEEELAAFGEEDDKGKFTWDNLRRRGGNSTPADRPGQWFPLYYHPETKEIRLEKFKKSIEAWPVDPKGIKRIWRVNPAGFEREYNLGNIEIQEIAGRIEIRKKSYEPEGRKPKTIWKETRYSATTHGTKLLADILGKNNFTYPKSVYAVEDCLKYWLKSDGIVLDFFAGSGTTAHAVLQMNKQDDGQRRFILCTNNENNICSDVCYPRIKKIISGYKFRGASKELLYERKLNFSVIRRCEILKSEIQLVFEKNDRKYDQIKGEVKADHLRIYGINRIEEKRIGLGGNVKYFKTSFVKRSISKDSLKIRITRECTEMLCLREEIFEELKKTDDYCIFGYNDRIMGVYYSLERDRLKSLKKDIDKMKGKKILYCFTLDPLGLDKKDFQDWKDVSLEPIPQKILDIYEGIYEY
jgi:adenine-specific DNA-methyltransferase